MAAAHLFRNNEMSAHWNDHIKDEFSHPVIVQSVIYKNFL